MDDSFISLELYHVIIEFMDWNTLQRFKLSNKFCYNLYKKELPKRLKSPYPFGEKDASIKVIVNDIYLENIYCIIDLNTVFHISPNKYSMPYVSEVLHTWFHYSFLHTKWILTGKIIKSIIKIYNKLPEAERITDITEITFSFKDKKSYLSQIK